MSERQLGVGILGGVKHALLWIKIHHDTGHMLVLLNCSNALNTVRPAKVLKN